MNRINPPTLTRYQLKVLAAVPETGVDALTLAVQLHEWHYPGIRRAFEHLERCGLIAVTWRNSDGSYGVKRTEDGTAALTDHVKAERQRGLFTGETT